MRTLVHICAEDALRHCAAGLFPQKILWSCRNLSTYMCRGFLEALSCRSLSTKEPLELQVSFHKRAFGVAGLFEQQSLLRKETCNWCRGYPPWLFCQKRSTTSAEDTLHGSFVKRDLQLLQRIPSMALLSKETCNFCRGYPPWLFCQKRPATSAEDTLHGSFVKRDLQLLQRMPSMALLSKETCNLYRGCLKLQVYFRKRAI